MGAVRDVEELRRLVALLENSGTAQRADVRALLAASRVALATEAAPLAPRVAGTAAGKLGHLALLGLDATALALSVAAVLSAQWRWLTPPAAWVLLRGRGLHPWLREGLLRLGFWLGWGWDWLAEAFSAAAARRLAAREAARAVHRGWRRRAARLRDPPDLAAVEAFLHEDYGPAALAAFRRHAIGLAPAASRRLEALWGSALLRGFGEVAGDGAFWAPRALPAPPSPAPGADPAAEAERAARRAAVQEALRKRRQEVNTAHGWKLKTPAELAERDRHLGELRGSIAALEAELKAL